MIFECHNVHVSEDKIKGRQDKRERELVSWSAGPDSGTAKNGRGKANGRG